MHNQHLTIEYLEWDSAHFGFPVGKLHWNANTNITPADLLAWKQQKFQLLYLTSPQQLQCSTSPETNIVQAEERLTFSAKTNNSRPLSPLIKVATPAISEQLYPLAQLAATYSRFNIDVNFNKERIAALYRIWIEASFNGSMADTILYTQEYAEISGMIALKKEAGKLRISLIAVAAQFQRNGYGSVLINAAHHYAAAHDCSSIVADTQAINKKPQTFTGKTNLNYIELPSRRMYGYKPTTCI